MLYTRPGSPAAASRPERHHASNTRVENTLLETPLRRGTPLCFPPPRETQSTPPPPLAVRRQEPPPPSTTHTLPETPRSHRHTPLVPGHPHRRAAAPSRLPTHPNTSSAPRTLASPHAMASLSAAASLSSSLMLSTILTTLSAAPPASRSDPPSGAASLVRSAAALLASSKATSPRRGGARCSARCRLSTRGGVDLFSRAIATGRERPDRRRRRAGAAGAWSAMYPGRGGMGGGAARERYPTAGPHDGYSTPRRCVRDCLLVEITAFFRGEERHTRSLRGSLEARCK